MRAAILAVGTELLGSERVDTNSLRLAAVLARFGVALSTKTVVGDDAAAIGTAVGQLMRDHDLVLVTGGLGPTQDDLTREAIAEVVERPLVRDQEVLEDLRGKFASFGVEMAPVNERQADVIEGAEVLRNRRGTAPGLMLEHNAVTLFLFPGVPTELEGLVESSLVPWLERTTSGSGLETGVLKVACVPESTLEQRLQGFYSTWGEEGVALLPSPGEVAIRLSVQGTSVERAAWLEPRVLALRALLSADIFTDSADQTLEQAAGHALRAAGLSIATAESCTGGLIAERLTRVDGSSDYFVGSIVSYANEVKSGLLGVAPELIAGSGAVSEEVALEMARGARERMGSDLSLAVTGIAGPTGGSPTKPVGTVHVALCGPLPDGIRHRVLHLPGDRQRIRWVTSQWALEMIRRLAIGEAGLGRP